MPIAGVAEATVAVKVTLWPNVVGLTDETTVLIDPACRTCSTSALEMLATKLGAPA